jgi:hypothetical protein
MNHLEKRYAPESSIGFVMHRTGCTRQEAIDELIAEEGDMFDALIHLNHDKAKAVRTTDDPKLLPRADWQTQQRGTNDQEYQIYVANAEALGWTVKTYEEWLAS